jgi:hypothetical protein
LRGIKLSHFKTIETASHWDCIRNNSETDIPTWDESFLHPEFDQEILSKKIEPWENPFLMEFQQIEPSFLPDSDGNCLLYSGSRHLIIGKTQTLKSWILIDQIAKCNLVYFDFENGPGGMVSRLRALRKKPEDCAVFVFMPSVDVLLKRIQEIVDAESKPDLVVFDSFHGLATTLGFDPDNNNDVQKALEKTVNRLHKVGVSTVVIDHLPKSSNDANDDAPIGAIAKKNQADVVLLMRHAPNSNTVNVFVTKDRFGMLYKRSLDSGTVQKLCEVLLHEHDEFIDVRVIPDMQLFFDGIVIDSRTASEINKIYTFLNDFPDSAKSQIDKGVGGNHGRIADALAKMEAAGVISKVKEGNAHRYRTRKQLNIEKR